MVEEAEEQRVPDLTPVGVELQVAFGDVGRVLRPIDEDVIPGLVARRSRPRDGLVPLVGAREFRIDIDDDASVLEAEVAHDLAGGKLRFRWVSALWIGQFAPWDL